jgi:hypothetical protein
MLVYGFLILRYENTPSTFYFGLGIIPYALSIFVMNFWGSELAFFKDLSNTIWAICLILPFITLLSFSYLTNSHREFQIQPNTRNERLTSLFGLLLTILLLIGDFLPWDRDIYRAGGTTWRFKGSGTRVLIKDCCYLTANSFSSILTVLIPILGLAGFFLLRLLGIHILASASIVGIFWTFQESINFLSHLGAQKPPSTWSQADIDANSLTATKVGLPGGYLFILATIAICVVLLLPRVLSGRNIKSLQ